MRKNILSLSIAAMIGGWNLPRVVGLPREIGTDLLIAPEGIGHILRMPHYISRSHDIPRLIAITPEPQGKAVKVRFRGASSGEDVFDFALFFAPGDVWKPQPITKG